jgi:hypothetical protein
LNVLNIFSTFCLSTFLNSTSNRSTVIFREAFFSESFFSDIPPLPRTRPLCHIRLLWRGAAAGLPDLSWYNIPKREKYTKINTKIPYGSKMDKISVKFTSILHCTALQNLPKLGVLVRKYVYYLATLRSRPQCLI